LRKRKLKKRLNPIYFKKVVSIYVNLKLYSKIA